MNMGTFENVLMVTRTLTAVLRQRFLHSRQRADGSFQYDGYVQLVCIVCKQRLDESLHNDLN
jgi:hypothetical protein